MISLLLFKEKILSLLETQAEIFTNDMIKIIPSGVMGESLNKIRLAMD